ncbi:MAG: tol-pal system YbgF family protein [Planctomycetota bacterium]
MHVPGLAVLSLVWALVGAAAPHARAQNSSARLRAAPSPLAERAGAAIPWAASVEDALAAAVERGLPVFWYVPTVAGSPMDRQAEIDRYLRAGPFCWPSTIELLSTHFVPVREVPTGDLQRRYQLRRGEFIEPGWLVLAPDGAERARLDQVTTLHPRWFEAPLRALIDVPDRGFPCTPALQDAWGAWRAGTLDECERLLTGVLDQHPAAGVGAEAAFLRGAVLWRQRREDEATAAWRAIGATAPDSPWAAKAAMEAEGHGPFVRCFEDWMPLRDRVLRDRAEGSRAPRGTWTEAELWQHGVELLLRWRRADGLWRDSIYDFGGTDSLPNVHLAISFLAGEALLHAAARADAGAVTLAPPLRAELDAQLQRLLAIAGDDARFALEDRDEILWAQAYRVRFLARWLEQRGADRDAATARLQAAVAAVAALQPEDGVWFHEYGNPFAIATALQALARARAVGAEVPPEVVDRGVRALLQCRTRQGAFTYGHPGRRPARAEPRGAAGRMPLCELALLLWEHSDQPRLQAALTAAFEHHGLLAAVRKYDDHADRLGYGGFFFWFDMLGRAEATMQVADGAQRGLWRAQQKKLVLDLPEFDGGFVDSHELGRSYGTAMALLCLAALDP